MSVFFRQAPASTPAPVEQRSVSYQNLYGTGGDVDLFPTATTGALSLVPLFAAHRTIIDAVSTTPLHAYEEQADGTTRRMAVQPLLLTEPPHGLMTAWKAAAVASLLADGNAFGLPLAFDSMGYVEQLLWVDPARVTIDDSKPGGPVYYYDGARLERGEIVHIPWIVPPGKVRALSPLKAFRVAFEMTAAAQSMGRDWFVNGAIPSGHLKSTGELDPPEADRAKRRFKAAVRGRDVFVSGDDWTYEPLAVPADEARFVETLNLSAQQIASIYGLRPEDIGGQSTGPALEYKNLESDMRRESGRVVAPWAVRIEEALSSIRPPREFSRFDLDARVRADLKTRMEAHEIALRTGVELIDEARRAENRPPLTPEQQAQWNDMFGRKAAALGAAPAAKGQQA